MKNKKALIVIIVLLIILSVCGGAFAYVYFATDLLKSNSQMFSKYGTMLDMELYNFFYDENIKTYYTNKSANNYENTGVLRVKSGGNTDINADLNLTFKGTTDVDNDNFEQEITINYSDSEKFAFKLVKNNQMIALGSDEVANKYVGIKNENLDELSNKLGIDEEMKVPSNIKLDKSSITVQNIKSLVTKYIGKLAGQLSESNFTKNNNTSYTLTIEKDNLKNIMIYCLNEAKNDSEIIEMLGMSDDISTYQDNIDQEIDNLNEQDFSNTSIKITLTSTENGVEADVKVNTDEDNVEFSVILERGKNITIKQTGSFDTADTTEIPNDIEYTISKEKSASKSKYTITSSEENYSLEIGFELDSISDNGATEKVYVSYDVNDVQFNVEYNNAITFKDVTVTELNDENSVALNDYSQEELSSLLQQLLVQVITVNSQKIQNANVF